MNATLIRSAYTPIIYEMKDCSVALLDADHRVLGQSAGLPIFLGNLEICTRLTEEAYGREGWQPGDVWVMNDSYMTGTHLNDMTVFGPIFVERRARRGSQPAARTGSTSAPRTRAGRWTRPRSSRRGSGSARPRSSRAASRRRDVTDLLGAKQSLRVSGDRRHRRADRVRPDRARSGCRRSSSATARRRSRPRATRSSPRRSGSSVRRSSASPTASTRPRARSTTTATARSRCWVRLAVEVSGDEMTIDLTESDDARRRAGQLRRGAGDLRLPCRLQAADQPRQPAERRRVPSADRRRSPRLRCSERRSRARASGTSRTLGLLIDLVVKALARRSCRSRPPAPATATRW